MVVVSLRTNVKDPCWFVSWVLSATRADLFPVPFHAEEEGGKWLLEIITEASKIMTEMTLRTSGFSGLHGDYKALEDILVPSHCLPFMVHFDILRNFLSSHSWLWDDALLPP